MNMYYAHIHTHTHNLRNKSEHLSKSRLDNFQFSTSAEPLVLVTLSLPSFSPVLVFAFFASPREESSMLSSAACD